MFGGDSGGATPVPIPNTEVKPSSADGTAWETLWESKKLPGFIFIQKAFSFRNAFFVSYMLKFIEKFLNIYYRSKELLKLYIDTVFLNHWGSQ